MAGRQGSGSASWIAMITAIAVVLLFCGSCAMAATYTVGDSKGWTLGYNYHDWASQHTFNIGDKLIFKYTKGMHTVLVTEEASYKACNFSAQPLLAYASGQDVVPIQQNTMYFICGIPTHCSNGMALAINASGAPLTPSTTPPPPPSGSSPPNAALSLRSGSMVLLSGILISGLFSLCL